jgi:hypothetical protein
MSVCPYVQAAGWSAASAPMAHALPSFLQTSDIRSAELAKVGSADAGAACSSCDTESHQHRQHAAVQHLYASHLQVPAASNFLSPFMPQSPPVFSPSHPHAFPPFDLAIQVGLQYVR